MKKVKMKEIRDRYDIFLKVCETGNFSRAAETLNYTQSGISQMMAGLEEELGVQLFARIKKGVILTDNGKRLLPYIQEMVNQKDKLRQAAFNINNKVEGKLRIGSFTSVTAMWMPDVIRFFQKNYPQVEVQIFDGNYDEIRDWIIHGQVDCGFLSSIVAFDLKFYPLLEDPLCAVMPKGHPLSEKKPQVSYSFRDDTLIMAFVKNGFGVTVSQDLVMKAFSDEIEVRPLDPGSHRTIGLALARTTNSVVSGVLLDYLQHSLQKYDSILSSF